MKFHVEGYGCSLNRSDTEKIRHFLSKHNCTIYPLDKAETIIINTCAVKEPTEFKMLNRIRELKKISDSNNAELIVFGCLAGMNAAKVMEISKDIILIPPSLEELARHLGIEETEFSPAIESIRENEFVAIIPISRGCRNNCSYCGVKQVRGELKSYGIKELKENFTKEIARPCEVWLTAQDTADYGFDLGNSLPELLGQLLEIEGNYMIRIGMMNPKNLMRIKDELIPLMQDERVYKFLHIPVQSGSDRILKAMKRNYIAAEFLSLAKELKEKIPGLNISTDVIVGFPGESKDDFKKSVELLKELKPGVVNISRYGDRPNTAAEKMDGKIHGRDKKARSRELSSLCREIFLGENKAMEGKTLKIFVSEKGPKGGFVGRNLSYKPVVIGKDLMGKMAKVKILRAHPFYLEAMAEL
ncbi:MAG: tRNA (N(6)-L-threonylcarbamoyladenosine(37)-C(2))-methylthiotransferase [Candidatus Diapherotrites archaeon]